MAAGEKGGEEKQWQWGRGGINGGQRGRGGRRRAVAVGDGERKDQWQPTKKGRGTKNSGGGEEPMADNGEEKGDEEQL